MKPLRIRISRVIDHGTIVSLVGIDTETAEPVTIHVDHRPSGSFWEAWHAAGCPEPIEYVADRLTLHLDMLPDEDADEIRLVECGSSDIAATDRQSTREIEQ